MNKKKLLLQERLEKTAGAVLLSGVIALSGAGCSNQDKIDSVTPNTTSITSVIPEVTPIVSPEATLSPEALAMNEKMALAPEIAGLNKKIINRNGMDRVCYIGEKGNNFGVEAGKYAGEFRKEVTLEGKEVGGVALVPKVVEKLLKDRGKDFIFVPADIGEMKDGTDVDLQLMSAIVQGKEYQNVWLKIDTKGSNVSISNPMIDIKIIKTKFGDRSIFPKYIINAIGPDLDQNNKFDFIIMGNFVFGDNEQEFKEKISFGQKITETNNLFGLAENIKTSMLTIDETKILKVNKLPVFMIDR